MATKKATVNKTAWVLQQPKSMSAAEVIEKAKSQGITMKLNYVYKVRSYASTRSSKPSASPTAKARIVAASKKVTVSKASAVNSVPTTGANEKKFLNLAFDLGLSRATALVGKLRSRVQAN